MFAEDRILADQKGGTIKRLYSLVLQCLVALGAVAADKIIGVILYWSLFPVVIGIYGVWKGLILLFIVQIAGSLLFLVIYDNVGNDVLRISVAIGMVSRAWHWLKGRIFKDEPLLPDFVSRAIKFGLLSWQLLPPLVVLIFRKGGVRAHVMIEAAIVLGSTAIATAWWALYSLVILDLWEAWSPAVKELFRR